MTASSVATPPRGAPAALIARALGIPAARIRKWAQFGWVCRHDDGSLDPLCVAAFEARAVLGDDFERWHAERCGVATLRTRA